MARVYLARTAREALAALDFLLADAVLDALAELGRDPHLGHQLRGRLTGLRSYRVGVYQSLRRSDYDQDMSRTPTSHWPCSIARTADLLADAWTLLILRECFYGAHRFEQFVENLGIGRATLSARLHRLTAEGLLETERYSEHARRVDYRLTPKGRATLPILATLMRWGDDWLAGNEGPPVELLHPDTAERFNPIVVDEATHAPLPQHVRVRPRTAAAIDEAARRHQAQQSRV